ncbi:hypothetical protein HPB48_021872 [Haemaphysalis longicornis]|uniref:Uncharacterized protein n=1 Tax=Haemaphysalis longicornis TaxID=44386 RepID=A0A9J6G2F1_HAELO|nr:hypothetical protein HPB48_021872 [Haemaphysalis longicornis]
MNLRVGTELKVDLLGAIHMMTSAWNGVKKETVANCFRKAGFVTAELSEACEDGDDDDECVGDTFCVRSETCVRIAVISNDCLKQ